MVMPLLAKGHIADPVQAAAYQTITVAARVLKKQPELENLFYEVVQRRRASAAMHKGPGQAFIKALKTCDLILDSGNSCLQHAREDLRTEELPVIPWLQMSLPKLQHEIREGQRHQQWVRVAARRSSFDALSHGIDREVTMEVPTKGVTGLEKYQMRCIMVGAVPTMKRLFRENRVDSALCPCCGREEEDEEHLFLRCPRHEDIRNSELEPHIWQHLPRCLKLHGLVPKNLELPKEDALDLACRVQYTLLDILENRTKCLPVDLQPRARWESRNVRPRLA